MHMYVLPEHLDLHLLWLWPGTSLYAEVVGKNVLLSPAQKTGKTRAIAKATPNIPS